MTFFVEQVTLARNTQSHHSAPSCNRGKTPSDGLRPPAPRCGLRFASVDKESGAKEGTGPPQSGFARQIPLYDLHFASVDKGSDAYQTIYRDTNEYSV